MSDERRKQLPLAGLWLQPDGSISGPINDKVNIVIRPNLRRHSVYDPDYFCVFEPRTAAPPATSRCRPQRTGDRPRTTMRRHRDESDD